MSDTCPVHTEIVKDIREDINEVKEKNKYLCTEINNKVPNKLFYWIIGIAFSLFTFVGGIQIYSSRVLDSSVRAVSESVVELKVDQKNIKENQQIIRDDVEKIKERIPNR